MFVIYSSNFFLLQSTLSVAILRTRETTSICIPYICKTSASLSHNRLCQSIEAAATVAIIVNLKAAARPYESTRGQTRRIIISPNFRRWRARQRCLNPQHQASGTKISTKLLLLPQVDQVEATSHNNQCHPHLSPPCPLTKRIDHRAWL
jgi:hypothetical protein